MFNNNSRIVAIKPSGNVFAAEAVEELNYKAKSWNDLLTGEEFTKQVRGAVVPWGRSMGMVLDGGDFDGEGGQEQAQFVVRGGDEVSVLSLKDIASRKSFAEIIVGGTRVEEYMSLDTSSIQPRTRKARPFVFATSRTNPIKPKQTQAPTLASSRTPTPGPRPN